MALSMADCKRGTVVDHYWQIDQVTGKEKRRPEVRRGIIAKVQEDPLEVWIKFTKDETLEKISTSELNRVRQADKESLRLVNPTVDNPQDFMQYTNGRVASPVKIVNELNLGTHPKGGKVAH